MEVLRRLSVVELKHNEKDTFPWLRQALTRFAYVFLGRQARGVWGSSVERRLHDPPLT